MEFIDELEVAFEFDLGIGVNRTYKPIEFTVDEKHGDKAWMSIQGSVGHYCSPRLTFNPRDYYSMEIAFVDQHGNFMQVQNILPEFDEAEELASYFNGSTYGYVVVETIEKIYQELIKKYRK